MFKDISESFARLSSTGCLVAGLMYVTAFALTQFISLSTAQLIGVYSVLGIFSFALFVVVLMSYILGLIKLTDL